MLCHSLLLGRMNCFVAIKLLTGIHGKFQAEAERKRSKWEDKEKHGDNVKEEEKKEDEGGKDDELILGGNFIPEFPDRGRPGDCQRCLNRKFTSEASIIHTPICDLCPGQASIGCRRI